ncbi:MAG: glycoside hydrolase family 71/99-like protein [Bacteroidales bacterium]|nr:glycoside hydrolase family 71/99-like protein [Bacteroidales bacterium]
MNRNLIKVIAFASLFFATLFILSCSKNDSPGQSTSVQILKPVAVPKTNDIKIYVHYMPWFETPSSSTDGKWGIHWRMSNCNPDVTDSSGRRQIASWFYPLIGPYATSDRDVIEYHLLLMKYAGIDGILFDWYGSNNLYDYPDILKNTESVIDFIAKVGLSFGIVYEDRTVKAAIEANPEEDGIFLAQQDMGYIEKNYFSSSNYINIDNRPLLMLFGPEYFHSANQWSEIFTAFTKKPIFLVLNGKSLEVGSNSSGEYLWVDASDVNDKYKRLKTFSYWMAGAYPGFKDYYKEGGWGSGIGFTYDYENGNLFQSLLNKATDNKAKYLQLITWNDFGEGTMIEPTVEFGFTFLELLQAFSGVTYNKNELQLIHRLYLLRKKMATNTEAQKKLNQAFYYLVALKVEDAKKIIETLESK